MTGSAGQDTRSTGPLRLAVVSHDIISTRFSRILGALVLKSDSSCREDLRSQRYRKAAKGPEEEPSTSHLEKPCSSLPKWDHEGRAGGQSQCLAWLPAPALQLELLFSTGQRPTGRAAGKRKEPAGTSASVPPSNDYAHQKVMAAVSLLPSHLMQALPGKRTLR